MYKINFSNSFHNSRQIIDISATAVLKEHLLSFHKLVYIIYLFISYKVA